MKCSKCGNELRRSKKDPSFGLCDNCRLKYRWVDEEPDYEEEYDFPETRQSARNAKTSSRKPSSGKGNMQTWKLVSGIISCVLFILVTFQSCAAGVANTLTENGEVGGSAGMIVSIMLLAGGIVSIVTRKKRGGNIAILILYLLGAIFGFALAGSYADLNIWAAWCLICSVLALISFIRTKNA